MQKVVIYKLTKRKKSMSKKMTPMVSPEIEGHDSDPRLTSLLVMVGSVVGKTFQVHDLTKEVLTRSGQLGELVEAEVGQIVVYASDGLAFLYGLPERVKAASSVVADKINRTIRGNPLYPQENFIDYAVDTLKIPINIFFDIYEVSSKRESLRPLNLAPLFCFLG